MLQNHAYVYSCKILTGNIFLQKLPSSCSQLPGTNSHRQWWERVIKWRGQFLPLPLLWNPHCTRSSATLPLFLPPNDFTHTRLHRESSNAVNSLLPPHTSYIHTYIHTAPTCTRTPLHHSWPPLFNIWRLASAKNTGNMEAVRSDRLLCGV